MIIRKYGIELHRLTEADIELVRSYRNSEAIRTKMFYQKEITIEDQKKWFLGINNALNYYFLVIWKGKKIGLIHGEITSLDQKITTGGVFFWDEDVLLSYVPVCASIIMGDLTFYLLKMTRSTAVVRRDNNKALLFNSNLGYEISRKENQKIHLQLDLEGYKESKLRLLVKRITKDHADLSWNDIELTAAEMENKPELFIPEFLNQFKTAQGIHA